MKEQWRPVLGFKDYDVSSFGRVRSHDHVSLQHRREWRDRVIPGRILRPESLHKGHLRVALYKNKRMIRIFAHHLVLFAFVGPRPKGTECRHLDGDPTNNRLENLKWGTPEENWADRYRHGNGLVEYDNNTSGKTGVSYEKKLGKWHAYIGYAPRKNIGWFVTKAEAIRARLEAEAGWG